VDEQPPKIQEREVRRAKGLATIEEAIDEFRNGRFVIIIDDEDRVPIGQRFQRVIAHNVAQTIGIPVATAEDRLLTPRAGIASGLRAHPARLARLVPQQPIQKLSRRRRHPLATEQETNPSLYIS